jgi:heme/copper-type cytochrome/quinol oxidase subunit 3
MTVTPVDARSLPIDAEGNHAPGWWGMIILIATEATLFAALLSSYFYIRSGSNEWPLGGIAKPEFTLAGPGTVILIASSLSMMWGEAGIRRGSQGRLLAGMLISILLGLVFLGIQVTEYSKAEFTPRTNVYGSLFFTITGIHGLHVILGVLMLSVVALRAKLGHFTASRHLAVQNVGLYWHFVDAVWIFVFASLYVSPRFL